MDKVTSHEGRSHGMELRERIKQKKPRKPRPRTGRFDATRNKAKYRTNPSLSKEVATRSKKNLTVLQRSYLNKVIQKMKDKKNNVEKKNQHRLAVQYSTSGEIALQRCSSTSLGVVMNNYPLISMFRCTVNELYSAIRSAILNHNWPHCLVLFTQLMHLKGLNKRHAIHMLRVIIIAMFNSNVGGDAVEKFLRVSLGLLNHETKKNFLRSLFILPVELRGPRPQRPRGSRKKVKEELLDAEDVSSKADYLKFEEDFE